MKKKILGIILAGSLLAAQAVTVFAEGSRTAAVTLPGDYASYYELTEGTAETFSYLEADHPEVLETILAINNGEKDLQAIAEQAPELAEALAGKDLVTPFFDLVPINGGIQTEDGKYLVTLEVPSLTTAMTEVKLLHYSTVRNLWEIVEPTEVNYDEKLITAEFEDLSPVAVIAKVNAEATEDTAARTGDSSGSMVGWSLGIAVVAAAVIIGCVAYRKMKNN